MSDSQKCSIAVGLDVAKNNFEAVLLAADQDKAVALSAKPFERSLEGAQALLEAIDATGATLELADASVLIVMEATGDYSQQLAERLLAARPEVQIAIVNPAFIKGFAKSLGSRNKTDRADARLIAQYGLERNPRRFVMMPKVLKNLRALARERHAIIGQIVQITNRNQEKEMAQAPAVVLKSQEAQLQFLQAQLQKMEKAMIDTIRQDENLAADFQLLQTMPGVGKVTAITVMAELGDLRQYRRSRQLSAYAGTNPSINESGTMKRRTRLCKMGRARVRQCLYMGAMACVKKAPESDLGKFYMSLVEKGKPKRVALCALVRKMLVILRAMVIQGIPYQDGYSQAQPVENLCKSC